MKSVAWPGTAAEWRSLLRELQFRHFKWDLHGGGHCLLLPEALALSLSEHAAVIALCERFDRILGRLEQTLLARPDLLVRLGIPAELVPLLRTEAASPNRIARYDVFRTVEDQWVVSEFNEDVPGGYNEAQGIPEILGHRWNGHAFPGDLRAAILDALAPFDSVALLHATGYAEDLQHMLVVAKWLRQTGREPVLASPAHLRGHWRGPRLLGRRCHAALRFYPGEWFRWLPNLPVWRRHLPAWPMMNPLRRLIRQSKLLFALWHEEDCGLDTADRAFLRNHAPDTVPFDPSRLDHWERDRESWVLKAAFGRMGESVLVGALAKPAEWSKALATAARRPGEFCLQRRFRVRTVDFASGPSFPSLGPYLVNGRFAGYYSRTAAIPFVTHNACHVPTVVEAA
ncbi:MAG: hypothetical protein EA425_12200 [Puniceicoccaceae bacterium]|nr:MAG: hypothetical protein EA425_12200 [Puniceicoccaceae bacterium]